MPDTIDSLQIEINAKAAKANDAIDRLVNKIDRLTISLGKVNGVNLSSLADGVQKLGNSMQVMKTVKTADFTRLATNLTKLGNINASSINNASSSLNRLINAFNRVTSIQSSAQQISQMAASLSKLGGASAQRAVATIPQLANAMNGLITTLSRAPSISRNVISLTNALANFTANLSNVNGAKRRTSTMFNSMLVGVSRLSFRLPKLSIGFRGLASAIGKFYATYFFVIRGLKGLWKSIESTADYIEAYNYFNVALGKIGADWSHQFEQYGYKNAESYADSFGTRLSERLGKLSGLQVSVGADGQGLLTESGLKNLGLNIQEITQYASQLASVTNSIGQTGEVSLATASAFTKLAGDISSLFNVDYSSVSKNLQSGLIGQSRALYKYGIDITNATLQTYAYNLGLSKSVSEMTQAEKMQLRMLAILDQSKVSWGDLANTINSPSNMIRQFKNNLKETGMVLGQLFIPVLQKVLPVINGITIAIKRLLVYIAGLLGIKIDFDAFGQGYSSMEDDIGDVSGAYDDATKAAKKFKTTTLGIDELNINAPQEDGGSGSGVGGGGIDLTKEILKATEEYEKAWNEAYERMKNKSQELADKLVDAFKSGDFVHIGKYISDSITKALSDINWSSAYKVAENFGKGFADFLNGLISPELFVSVTTTIAGALNTALHGLNSFGKTFDWDNLGKSIADGINNLFKTFDFKEAAESVNNWVKGLLSAGISLLDETDFEEIGTQIGEFLEDIDWVGIFSKSKELGTKIITSLFKVISNSFSKAPIETVALIAIPLSGLIVKGVLLAIKNLPLLLTSLSDAPVSAIVIGVIGAILGGLSVSGIVGSFLFPEDEDLYAKFNIRDFSVVFSDLENTINGFLDFVRGVGKENPFAMTAFLGSILGIFSIPVYAISALKGAMESDVPVIQFLAKLLFYAFIPQSGDIGAIEEGISEMWNTISNAFKKKWEEIVIWWRNSGIAKFIEKDVKPWFTKEKWTNIMKQIPYAFSEIFKSAKNAGITQLNNMLAGLELFINNWIDGVNKIISGVSSVASIIGIKEIPVSIKPVKIPRIPQYELGGFPEDGWFRASRGEIMGEFDNGQSVVANNMQIIDGISIGVKEAVAELLVPYLSDISRNTKETAEKEMSVNIGDKDIARANARGKRMLGYQLVT